MAIQATDTSDAAMILEGLARALEFLPDDGLLSVWPQRKAELIDDLRGLAMTIWPDPGGQGFSAGAAYSASEYRDEILSCMLPTMTLVALVRDA